MSVARTLASQRSTKISSSSLGINSSLLQISSSSKMHTILIKTTHSPFSWILILAPSRQRERIRITLQPGQTCSSSWILHSLYRLGEYQFPKSLWHHFRRIMGRILSTYRYHRSTTWANTPLKRLTEMISLMAMLLPSLLLWEVQPILLISSHSLLSPRSLSQATNSQPLFRFRATAHPPSHTHKLLREVAYSSFRAKTSNLSLLN